MSEIKMTTIENLPLVEEPVETASVVGWNDGQTVRMPISAVGGKGGGNIVFSYSMSTESFACNVSTFDEFEATILSGAQMCFIGADTEYSSIAYAVKEDGQWYISFLNFNGETLAQFIYSTSGFEYYDGDPA